MFFLPSWFIFSLLTGVTSNAFNFLNRFILRDGDDATVYAWYFATLRFFAFALFAFFDWHLILTPQSFLLFLLLGFNELISGYFYMKMHAYSHLSISTIIFRVRMIWVPFLAFVFLHERLTINDYLGILIIFLGVNIVSSSKKLLHNKGSLFAHLAALTSASNVILISLLFPFASNPIIIAIMHLPTLLFYPLLIKQAKQRIVTSLKRNLPLKSFTVLLSIAAMFFFTVALRVGDTSKVNAVYQGMLILSVMAGIILLKERKNISRKIIGTTITIIGVVLVSTS